MPVEPAIGNRHPRPWRLNPISPLCPPPVNQNLNNPRRGFLHLAPRTEGDGGITDRPANAISIHCGFLAASAERVGSAKKVTKKGAGKHGSGFSREAKSGNFRVRGRNGPTVGEASNEGTR